MSKKVYKDDYTIKELDRRSMRMTSRCCYYQGNEIASSTPAVDCVYSTGVTVS
jgi:hypothetical protein